MASHVLIPWIGSKDRIWTDLYRRHFYQFKTGVRTRLTSQIKELGAILQKLINLDKIQYEKWDKKRWIGFVGDADALGPRVFGIGLGATTETETNLCSHNN